MDSVPIDIGSFEFTDLDIRALRASGACAKTRPNHRIALTSSWARSDGSR